MPINPTFTVVFQAIHADGTLGDKFQRKDDISPDAETAQRALAAMLSLWGYDNVLPLYSGTASVFADGIINHPLPQRCDDGSNPCRCA